VAALVGTLIDSQGNSHLHSDDWQRTIYIDTLGVGSTEFDVPDTMKSNLEASGCTCSESYFEWYDKEESSPVNRP
jgi:NTE family protein